MKPDSNRHRLSEFLESKVAEYNQPAFIADDPVSILHRYSSRQDREIAGLFAAVFSWGNRKTIISKTAELLERMDHDPYAFILSHTEADLKSMRDFKHRTFQATDLYYFIDFLHFHYSGLPGSVTHGVPGTGAGQVARHSLENAFTSWMLPDDADTTRALTGFHNYFFSLPEAPVRTRKHIATPERKSSCKRLNMYLRWMVRSDQGGVDFGIWTGIRPGQLVCPLDLHVARVARRLGLLTRKQNDWEAALELTKHLKKFDPDDPVKYDFALFGLGIVEKF
jgi:hypothetical protein